MIDHRRLHSGQSSSDRRFSDEFFVLTEHARRSLAFAARSSNNSRKRSQQNWYLKRHRELLKYDALPRRTIMSADRRDLLGGHRGIDE